MAIIERITEVPNVVVDEDGTLLISTRVEYYDDVRDRIVSRSVETRRIEAGADPSADPNPMARELAEKMHTPDRVAAMAAKKAAK